LWAVIPLAVSYGREVRTDSAGVFFALLALLLIVRLFERASLRDQFVAGLAGDTSRRARRRGLDRPAPACARGIRSGIAAGVGAAVVAFVLTTPYFLLDWSTARASLANESASHVGHDGFSPIGNLRWYLGNAIPNAISWPVAQLAVTGIIVAVVHRRDARRLVLLAGAATFLVAISTSKLHWNRWLLPILPVVVLFAADGLAQLASAIGARIGRRELASAFALAGVALVALWPAKNVIQLNVRESRSSTRVVARDWIEANVPEDSSVVRELKTAPLDHTDLRWMSRFSLPYGGWTLDRYRLDGFRYFVTNAGISGAYTTQPRRYPAQALLYRELRQQGCLLHVFRPDALRDGPVIRVYELPSGAGASCGRGARF